MAGKLACAAVVLLGLAVRPVCGQYDDIDFEKMMAGYEDMYGGGYGGYGGMGDMMPGLAGMMGGMGGGMGYGGYGYGDSGPAHTDLTDMADVEKFMDADPTSPCVIGFYNEDTHGEDVMTFRTAASRMAQMGVRFGLATEDDVLEKLKYKAGRVMAYPAKRFLVEGDRPKQRYPGSGPLDPEPLQMWVAKAVTPLVGLFTWESGIRYEQIGLPELTAYAQVDIVEKAEEFDKLASTLRAVATARPKKELSYVVADFDDMISLASRFKFPNEQKAPEERGVSVGIRKDNFFYRMDGEFSEAAVAAFVDEYVKGAVKPIHVEDIDEENPMAAAADQGDDEADSDVVVLNLDNFDAVVKEEGKDVMLEFYAPWCGHCKELKPVYAQVAAEVSDTPSIVVAKMDADANTPPEGFSIQSYPTLMFLKAGEKSNPIPYEGMRDVDSIVAFIRENASPPVAAAA